MREESEDPERPYIKDTIARITTDIQTVRNAIRAVEPVEFCSACNGQSCSKCRFSGYLSRGAANQRVEG
jgi:hypothetical protein